MRFLIASFVLPIALILIAPLAHTAGAEPANLFQLIKTEEDGARHSIMVRLAARIETTGLQRIARELKARETKLYSETIVNFYLPGHLLSSRPWASVVFEMKEQAKINGLRRSEFDSFIDGAVADKRDVIGAWIVTALAMPGKLTLIRDGKKSIAEWKLGDEKIVVEHMTDSWLRRGLRYDFVSEPKVSQPKSYFVVTKKGQLEIRVGKKLIMSARKIDKAFAAEHHARAAKMHDMQISSRKMSGRVGRNTDESVGNTSDVEVQLPSVDAEFADREFGGVTDARPGEDKSSAPFVPATELIRSPFPPKHGLAGPPTEVQPYKEDKAYKRPQSRHSKAAAAKTIPTRSQENRRSTVGDVAHRSFGR